MAQQHLYSRVPARLSLFNKTDGYDTFACSEGLTRQYIETELAKVYDSKPTKSDALLIQCGKLPPMYCQYVGKEKETVQSCVSFLTSDYTGERSSYLVHSLVLNEEEQKDTMKHPSHSMLNPALFLTDLASEELTSAFHPYGEQYPTLPYTTVDAPSPSTLLEAYEPEMLKKLIYACISLVTGKTKAIFLSFNDPLETFSATALGFLNTFLQIFPYHLRPLFPFVSCVTDAVRYPNFRVRCIPGNPRDIPSAKGMSILFGIGQTVGISDEAMKSVAGLTAFFGGVLENDAVRREFLHYTDLAVTKMPALEKPTLKNLTDLVLMFQVCSGFYSDALILPNDDRVYDFICTYDKYREALSDEYRAQALKFLARYPKKRVAISKNIFNRLSSIYPKEPIPSKKNVMDTVLDFIHTDVMRDKLFAFIRANYPQEDEHTRALINENLCRVYYGGFLQNPILSFFAENFASEPEETKEQIVEKLLLTLRTKEVQANVLTFLDRNYAILGQRQKEAFYSEFHHLLPEGDALAEKLVELVDSHIAEESDAFRAQEREELLALADADQKRRTPKLIPMFSAKSGFCADTILSQLFGEWYTRKAFTDYFEGLWERPLAERIDRLIAVWNRFPEMPAPAEKKMTGCVVGLFREKGCRASLSALTDAVTRLSSSLPKEAADFCDTLKTECLLPAICRAIPEVFTVKDGKNGVEAFELFAKTEPAVRENEAYDVVRRYHRFLEAAKKGNSSELIGLAQSFAVPNLRTKVADSIDLSLLTGDDLADKSVDEARWLVSLLVIWLKTEQWNIADAMRRNRAAIERRMKLFSSGMEEEQVAWETESQSLQASLSAARYLYESLSDEEKSVLFGDTCGLKPAVSDYLTVYSKKGRKLLDDQITSLKAADEPYAALLTSFADEVKPQKSGFLSRLFGKK